MAYYQVCYQFIPSSPSSIGKISIFPSLPPQGHIEMHSTAILATLTALMVTVLGASAATSSHTLATRDGPCGASSECCRPVLKVNACFAVFIRTVIKEPVLQCVNDQGRIGTTKAIAKYWC